MQDENRDFLLERLQQGDEQAFRMLFEEFYASLCLFAARYLRDREEAADVVQEEWIEDSEQEFRNQVMEEEVHRIFNHAIDNLPLQMRTVIRYSLDGLKNSEIAEKMGLAEGTIHAYKKEAYRKLKISMREYYYLLPFFLFMSR